MSEIDYSKYSDQELKDLMTQKLIILCHQYIIDWNGSRAARVAGYSENTCAEIAYENLRKPHVKEYINRIKDRIEQEAGISKLSVILEHKKLAFSSMEHLHDSWITRKEFESLSDAQMACIQEIQSETEQIISKTKTLPVECKKVRVKLFSKPDSLKEIAKLMAYYTPIEINNNIIDKGQDLSLLTDEECRTMAKIQAKLNGKSLSD